MWLIISEPARCLFQILADSSRLFFPVSPQSYAQCIAAYGQKRNNKKKTTMMKGSVLLLITLN